MEPEGKLLLMQRKNFHCCEGYYDELNNVLDLVQIAWMLCSEACTSGEEGEKDQRIWLGRQQWSWGNSGKTSPENPKDQMAAEKDWATGN